MLGVPHYALGPSYYYEGDTTTCGICFENIKKGHSVSGHTPNRGPIHVFHARCIDQLRMYKYNPEFPVPPGRYQLVPCPICRENMQRRI